MERERREHSASDPHSVCEEWQLWMGQAPLLCCVGWPRACRRWSKCRERQRASRRPPSEGWTRRRWPRQLRLRRPPQRRSRLQPERARAALLSQRKKSPQPWCAAQWSLHSLGRSERQEAERGNEGGTRLGWQRQLLGGPSLRTPARREAPRSGTGARRRRRRLPRSSRTARSGRARPGWTSVGSREKNEGGVQ